MSQRLFEVPPVVNLTARQARALELVQAAGTTGIHADELGAQLHAEYRKHDADRRCKWCGATGQDLLVALKKKGLVRYRRGNAVIPGYWQATGAGERPGERPSGMLADSEAIPF